MGRRRNWNGLSGGPVMGRRSNFDGKGKGGRWLARQGTTSWVPGNVKPTGFGNSPNVWNCLDYTTDLVSLWTFGEGTGTTLHDVAPLTEQQNLTFDTPQGTGAGLVTSSNFTWNFNSDLGRWYGSVSGIPFVPGGQVDKVEPSDGMNPNRGGICELTDVVQDQSVGPNIEWNQFSVELWISSTGEFNGTGMIMGNTRDRFSGFSKTILHPNWAIWEASGNYVVGVRTYSDWTRFTHTSKTPNISKQSGLQHLVLTCKPGGPWLLQAEIRLWVNGKLEIDVLQSWQSFLMETEYLGRTWKESNPKGPCTGVDYHYSCWTTKLGRGIPNPSNPSIDPEEWIGHYYQAATYDKALSQGEVQTKFDAGYTMGADCLGDLAPIPSSTMALPASSTLENCVNCNQTQYPPTTTFQTSITGIRKQTTTLNYSLSSPDGLVEGTDYADVTPHGYTTIPATKWASDITLSANPTSVSSGEIHITLSSTSLGILGSPLSAIQHKMTMKTYDTSCEVSGYGDRTLLSDYVSSLPIPFALVTSGVQAPHAHDVSAAIHLSAHPSNVLSYSITPSTIVFEPGKVNVSNNILAPATINPWVDGDSVRLIVSSAESDSGHPLSANVDEVITISNDISWNKPGPGSTGCRIPDYQLKDPNDAWWYDSANNFVSSNPGTIIGYKFNQAVLSKPTTATHGLSFRDCVFDGRDANGVDSIDQVIVGDDTHMARDLSLRYCTVRNSITTLISGCTLRFVQNCDFFESGYGGIHGLGASAGCIIKDNWIHQIGRKKDFGDIPMYGISLWGATSGATITGNYVDTRNPKLYDCDPITGVIGPGGSINCHAPHVSAGCSVDYDDYTPDGCIEVISQKAGVSGTVDVSGNWFGGWKTWCQRYVSGLSSFDASVTIQYNRYERDFVGPQVTHNFAGFWIPNKQWTWDNGKGTLADTWEDTGVPISYATMTWTNSNEWSLFACEFYNNCAPGTYDPDLDCSYYC